MDTNDWRAELLPHTRQMKVNEIVVCGCPSRFLADGRLFAGNIFNDVVNSLLERLARHLPFLGQEGLVELRKIAVRFEEKIYNSARNQSDYHRRISLKMMAMETRRQNPIANSLPSNFGDNRNGPSDTGFVRQAQVLEGQVAQSEGERNAAGRQSIRKRKQPQWLAEFVTY